MEGWDWSSCLRVYGDCVNASDDYGASVNVTTEMTASVRFRDLTRFWIQLVVVPFVVAFGVLSNSVTMVVLTRRRMRSSTNMYLTALAASDLMYLLFSFSMSWEHYARSHDTPFYFYWQYRRVGIWLTDATSFTSIWLTVSFTVERYIAVCHPMRGKVFCTESRARVVILSVYFLCFLVSCSTAFEWQTIARLKTDQHNVTSVYLTHTTTALGDNETYVTIISVFTSVMFVFLPLILLAIFNCFLINAVHHSQRQRCKMTQTDQSDHAQSQENRITVTLIAVVILFLVCQSPHAITVIYKLFYIPSVGSTGDNILRGLGSIFNFLVVVNASCNFILYCALSDKYRRTFLVTFLSCWRRSPRTASSLYYNNSMYAGNSSRHSSVRAGGNLVRAGTRLHTNNNGPQSSEVTFSTQPSLNALQNLQLTVT